jgi:ABC-2 type transport system ATP-binding protein
MIRLDSIAYRYPKRTDFGLSDVSFAVEPGEVFTLLGPNGAGKTTLIRILSGLILPQQGTVAICGHDLKEDEPRARGCLGLVLGDERTFYFRLSGRHNLEFFGGLYGLRLNDLKQRVEQVLSMVGLQESAGVQFMRYSSGMRKRLNLARALLHNPPVLLLDEPTSSVDPESAADIRRIILDLRRKGRTILLTTHNLSEAEKMSDRIGFLRDGRLVKIGALADYKAMVRRKRLRIRFATGAAADRLDREKLRARIAAATQCESVVIEGPLLDITHNGSFDMSAVLGEVARCGVPIESTQTSEASLEDVFMTLTARGQPC